MTKRINKILALAIAFTLSVAMLLGGGIMSAFAAPAATATVDPIVAAFNVPNVVRYGTASATVDSFGLTGTQVLVISAPNNTDATITVAEPTHTFRQVGVHTLEFFATAADATDEDVAPIFTTTVLVEMEGEFQLRVDYNGATIPTVWAAGRPFTLPYANLYLRAEGEADFVRVDDFNLEVRVSGGDVAVTPAGGNEYLQPGREVRFNQMGTRTIQYIARLDANGSQFFVESFTTRVQSASFEDTTYPRMVHVGVPTQASVNTRVTLPIASPTATYDDNVQVIVTVERYEGVGSDRRRVRVPEAIVDSRTGFAVGTVAGSEQRFDNVWNMHFYPTTTGTYFVTYVARTDFGRYAGRREFQIVVEDRSAPTLVNFDEDAIPSRWALEVLEYNPNFNPNAPVDSANSRSRVIENNYIHIPFPEFVDNGAGFRQASDGTWSWDENIMRVSFEIRDTANNRRVLYFNNILDQDGAGSEFVFNPETFRAQLDQNVPGNGFYAPELNPERGVVLQDSTATGADAIRVLRFDSERGLYFNFAHYVENNRDRTHSAWTGFDGLGRYTFQFQARDEGRQNISTRTFDVTLEQRLEDYIAPRINGLNDLRPIRVHEGMDTLTLPTATVTDETASRIRTTYRIGFAATDATGDEVYVLDTYIEVNNGETLDVARDGSVTFLRRRSFRDYTERNPRFNPASLRGIMGLADDATNSLFDAELAEAARRRGELQLNITDRDWIIIEVEAIDYVGNVTVQTERVRLVQDDNLTLSTAGANAFGVEHDNAGVGVNNGLVNLGSFEIAGIPNDYSDFVGFEINLVDSNGLSVAIDNLNTWFVPGTTHGVRHVDYMFAYLTDGDYTLYFRAFAIDGTSRAVGVGINVTGIGGGGNNGGIVVTSATANIGGTGGVRNTYILRNRDGIATSNLDTNMPFMVRNIRNATHFSLMGAEFTAFAPGSFMFNEGYFSTATTTNPGESWCQHGSGVFFPVSSYSANFTAAMHDVAISVHGAMPVHTGRVQNFGTAGAPVWDYANRNPDAPRPNYGWVELPLVTGHNGLDNANITIFMTNPNGQPVTPSAHIGALLQRVAPGVYHFRPTIDGIYQVRFRAAVGQSYRDTETFSIRVGNTIPVAFTYSRAELPSLALNDSFRFDYLQATVGELPAGINRDQVRVQKRLILPNGNVGVEVNEIGLFGTDWRTTRAMTSALDADGFTVTDSGDYRIEYIVTDEQGNQYILIREFSVAGAPLPIPVPLQVIATILVIVGALLIAGLILYVMRFRKKKIKA